MKRFGLLLGFASLLTVASCHKKTPVAAAPTVAPPVQIPRAEARPSPATSPAKAAAVKTPVSNPARTASAPSKLTPQERATLNERLARLSDALFDYDKATIRSDATNALKGDVAVIRDILANYPRQKLVVEGHADERGSSEYNLALGDKRAASAEDFLEMLGIPSAQLTIISYGKDRPVCNQQSEDCWQKNRRVHITAAP